MDKQGDRMRSCLIAALVATVVSACGAVLGLPAAEMHMVPARDGVLLGPDVYLPDSGDAFPTVLMRTTYNKDASNKGIRFSDAMAKPFVDAGYAFVVQDTRGRFTSEGVDSIFLTDGDGPLKDGYDTVEWIVQQSWSNGDVGIMGMSALGITSYMAAASGHPALKAAFVTASASNLYDDVFYPGGVYRQHMGDRWITGQGRAEFLPFIYAHASYDSVWQRVDLPRLAPQSHTAIYQWGGWFDCMSQGQTDAFSALQERGGDGARGNQMLLMGAWSHSGTSQTQGELRFPTTTNDASPFHEVVPWFDSKLKGAATMLDTMPPVRYYLMGDVDDSLSFGNVWMSADLWPPSGVSDLALYLRRDSSLAPMPPVAASASATYEYDPADPVPTLGGLNLYKPVGPADLRPVESRPDVLTFSTEPLQEPLAVAGKVRMKLFASSDCPDTDFMALLTDVYPDGRSMLIVDGAIRARYRESKSDPEYMAPGEVYEFDINLWDTAIVFNRGHRIRVDITSSNSPRFMPNPNTATAFHTDTVGVVATNTIRFDAAHPSALILPVLRVAE